MRMSCLSTSRSLFSIKLSVQAYSEGLQFEAFYKAVTLIFAFQHELKQRQAVGMINRAKGDRKSTRLNSSHVSISYAVFCLKKKRVVEIDGARLSEQDRQARADH